MDEKTWLDEHSKENRVGSTHGSAPLIYFTDFFGVAPEVLEGYGTFNVSLINDLPLFIDPFLLFDSEKPEFASLHDEIIRYVRFLRDVAIGPPVDQGLLDHWFLFPEVKQNWLGFSRKGNSGTGLGNDFAVALQRNLTGLFKDFGTEKITRGSHLEKLCLLSDAVGRDHLSDFTTNLVKGFLLEYTQAFARRHLGSLQRKAFPVEKVRFDYEARRWLRGKFELPAFRDDYVLLTPKEILTKDEAWINRTDLVHRFEGVYAALPDNQLRSQINEHFVRQLSDKSTRKEEREAATRTIERFPEILDYYIKDREAHAREAHGTSGVKVRETEDQFIRQVRRFVDGHLSGTEFYELSDSFEEALRRVHFLKDVVENKDGYRIFYVNAKPLKREADLQILYRLTWCATSFDVNREVNNGRGPVDFKISRGASDSSLVEFKLASNSKLAKNLEKQVAVYEAANNTSKAIKVILYFSEGEYERVERILKALGIAGRSDIVLIDARGDNKPSGSNA